MLRGFALLWRSARVAILSFLALQTVSGLALPAIAAATGSLVDSVASRGTGNQLQGPATASLAVITTALIARRMALAGYLFAADVVRARFTMELESGLLRAVGSLPGLGPLESSEFHKRVQLSSFAGRASQLVNQVGFGLMAGVVQTVGSLFILGRNFGWMWILLLALPSIPAALIEYRTVRKDEQLKRESFNERHLGYASYQLGFHVHSSREIRLFGMKDWMSGRYRHFRERWWKPVLSLYGWELRWSLAGAAVKALLAGALLLAGISGVEAGRLSPGDLVASVGALTVLLNGQVLLERLPARVKESIVFFPDYFWTIDLGARAPSVHVGGTKKAPDVFEGPIRFEGVTFRYPETNRDVLRGLDLLLPPATTTALVGENGAGKSTIVKLLCRYYDPDQGSITVDGVDIRELELASWRRRISAIFQEFVKWPLSLAENVACASEELLDDPSHRDQIADRAGLTSLVRRLPQGWDTILDRRFGGVELSGGEWQRVALARALAAMDVRNSPLLILDEPTAALDVRLEHSLFNRFAELSAGRTTLLISHRLSTVRMAETILVLGDGRLEESGSHEQLIAHGGSYAAMWNAQARRFADPVVRP